MKPKLVTCLMTATALSASADTLAQWTPVAGDFASSQYNSSSQTPEPTQLGAGVSSSTLARVNQPSIGNSGAVWPGYIANSGGTAGTYDPVTGGYTEFTLTPIRGASITYNTISYSLNSYGGMNDAAGYTGVVRSSVDSFASEIDTVTVTNSSTGTFLFDVSSLGAQSGAVTFRIYIVDNAGPNTWNDMTTTAGGLVVDGTATDTTEAGTWTADTSDIWESGGPDDNWSTSDGFFFLGDNVTFDDTVNPLFSGTVTITGTPPVPGAITVNNPTQDYVFSGEIGAGTGALTKAGTGLLSLLAPDSNMPFNAPIIINGGIVELAGHTSALQNSSGITVNPGGSFRVAAGNPGQDSLPPLTLAGGTLEMNDVVFTSPGSATIELAASTESTLTGTSTLIPFFTSISGSGNLIKDGTGTLQATDLGLTYTGSTTINDGLVVIGGNRTAASESWTMNGGELRLGDDNGTPIENLPATADLAMTGGLFNIGSNVESIASLSMDSTSGTPTLEVATTTGTSGLTVGTLEVIGTQNEVVLTPLPPLAPGTYTYNVLNFSSVIGDVTDLTMPQFAPGSYTFSTSAGILSVEIVIAPLDLTYTDASGNGVWDSVTADWDDGGSAVAFTDADSVTFDDSVDSGFSGTVTIVGLPIPGPITVNNLTQDYVFSGEIGAGTGALTKAGTGLLSLLAPDSNMPFNAPIIINGGTVELAGHTSALQNSSGITVNPGGSFRVAADNPGQDSLPPLTLAGGTLEMNDVVFTFPGSATIELAASTESTLTGTSTLIPFSTPISGAGNLIKDGTGTLQATSLGLTYTGSTTINDGLVVIGGNRTAASESWTMNGGELRLGDDNGTPIENLPATADLAMNGGLFDVTGNVETLASLAMDSTSGSPELEINPATTDLTVGDLTLVGTGNTVVLDPLPTTSGTYNVLTYTGALTGTLGTNLTLPQFPSSQVTWNDTAGVVSVTISLSLYDAWATDFGLENPWLEVDPLLNGEPTANPDGDLYENLLEYAFGFDPTVSDGGTTLTISGGSITQNGPPQIYVDPVTGQFFFRYTRRVDFVAAGLDYTAQFAADSLGTGDFEDVIGGSVVATGTGAGGVAIEAVSIEFPDALPVSGKKARFGRLEVTNP
jgi:fibronectin-binding autotransporter adhesin